MAEGKLYIIATPIGNLEDITFRAVNILKNEVDIIYCEDTRQSKKLLNHYNINISIRSLHAHSPDSRIEEACAGMIKGNTLAYMTDSGTPGISDPGNRLVKSAREKGITVIPLPGPSAVSAILSISGFSEKKVIFAGFLSKKEGKIKKELQYLADFQGIIILFESPYRIKKLIAVLNEIFPDNDILIAREMTKIYEEYYSGKISELFENIDDITEKGEFTLAIINRPEK